MPIQLERHTEPDAFRTAIDYYLRTNLAECNQLFNITQGLNPDAMRRRQSWLARLHRDDATCGVALIHSSPPMRELLLSTMDEIGLALLAAAMQEDGVMPTGVIGPPETAQEFARQLGRATVERAR